MIQIKNADQILAMKKAGRITGEALLAAREHVRAGVSTKYLDDVIRSYIERAGAKTLFPRLWRLPRQCLYQYQQ